MNSEKRYFQVTQEIESVQISSQLPAVDLQLEQLRDWLKCLERWNDHPPFSDHHLMMDRNEQIMFIDYLKSLTELIKHHCTPQFLQKVGQLGKSSTLEEWKALEQEARLNMKELQALINQSKP